MQFLKNVISQINPAPHQMKIKKMKKLLILLFSISAVSCSQNKEVKYPLLNLPPNFTELTEIDNELIIYNSIDMGNLRIRITEKKGLSELLFHGTQEDYLFEIYNSTIDELDTIRLYTQIPETDVKQVFLIKLINENQNLYSLTTTFPDENNGIISENRKTYILVDDKDLLKFKLIVEMEEDEQIDYNKRP